MNRDDEVKKLYGDVFIHFELVCSRMRYAILLLIFPSYNKSDANTVEIMLEGSTSDQLRRKLLALMIEKFKSGSDIYKSTKQIASVFEKIIPMRNSFAHGTPFIGQADFIEGSTDGVLTIRHPKLGRDGLDYNFRHFDIESLQEGIKILKIIETAIGTICILIKHSERDHAFKQKFLTAVNQKISSVNLGKINININ